MSSYRWFKIWAVGNGGQETDERFVYWPDYGDDSGEFPYMIEREIGPFSGGIRSVNWKRVKPPRDVILKRIETLKSNRRYALSEMRAHQKELDND